MRRYHDWKLIAFLLPLLSLSCEGPAEVPRPGNPPAGFPLIDSFPKWSPDSAWILYNHYGITTINSGGSFQVDPDSSGLWLVRPDASERRMIMKGFDIYADWSPDGTWLVLEGGGNIYKVLFEENKIDTANIQQLTFDGRNFFPAWSPEGSWIAYNKSICEGPNTCGIWWMNSDGLNQYFAAAYGNYPTWMPREDKILYLTPAITPQGETVGDSVMLFDIHNSTKILLKLLSGQNHDNRHPQYSPSGAKIAFQSAGIWIMDADGGNLQQLTSEGGFQSSWSPSGDAIAYIGSLEDGVYDSRNDGVVWIMNVDGSNKRQLTIGPQKSW